MIKIVKRILILLFIVVILSGIGLYIYSLDYYKADYNEEQFLANPDINIIIEENYIAQYPKRKVVKEAFIFYPGGKVEYKSYLPLLQELAMNGYLTIIVDMPLNLAVFNQSAADDIILDFPGIKYWYIGGHSLGGAMASSYLSKTEYELEGLILLGAYPVEDHQEDILILYGENDQVLSVNRISQSLKPIVIPGGNHAYFGDYGEQKGDGIATISRKEQQEFTIQHIIEFIKGR